MIRFRVLGPVDMVGENGRGDSLLRRPKRLALLAYLVLARPRGFQRRDSLVALFWPDLDEAHGRGGLRQLLHHLRRALAHDLILTRGDDEVAIDASRIWCDAVAFESHVDQGNLVAALELYRGNLLHGFHLSGSMELERWLEDEREYLRRRATAAAGSLVGENELRGDLASAIRWARRGLELSPYDEPAAQRLIRLLARTGARSEAIEAYETFAVRLVHDLELEASAETDALVRAIRLDRAGVPRPSPDAMTARPTAQAEAVAAPEIPPSTDSRPEAPAPSPGDEHPSLPVERPSPPVRRRGIRRLTSAIGALAITGLVVVSLVHARWRRNAGDDLSSRRVAVLPFSVSGNEGLSYLREGMADLLTTKLDGAGELISVDANALLAVAPYDPTQQTDPERARAIAQRFDAGLYVVGGLIDAGGRLRAKASLYDARGTLRGTAEAVVDDERRVFDLVDELARQLLRMSPVQPPERLARLGSFTTDSFAALKSYLAGERFLRVGQYDSAVASYERAVAADSAFALAYYRMAVARHHDATPTGAADAHRRARNLADRLLPRDRLLVEAFDAFERHQDVEAERLYREILSVHPDEVEAWLFLGQVLEYYGLWRGRPIADARSAFERVLALDPSHVGALAHLSWVATMEERFDDGAALIERLLAVQPAGHNALVARLRLALSRGDRREEAQVIAELRGRESAYINHAQRWAHFSGNLEGRQRVARLLTEPSQPARWKRLGHTVSARYELDNGHWRLAFSELAAVRSVDPDRYMVSWARFHLRPLAPTTSDELAAVGRALEQWAPRAPEVAAFRLYLLGAVRARLADSAGAEAMAVELEARGMQQGVSIESRASAAQARDLALGVRAWHAAEAGRLTESLAYLDRLQPERWWRRGEMGGIGVDAVQTWLRAELLSKLGREREALHLYAPLGWMWGDAGMLGPKHLRMAEIYEHLGDRETAAKHYKRFVELWKTSDPPLQPLVREVVSRLDRLRGS